ncbi:MAG: hypothetical protein IPI73_25380 [Betaproteobacteria bacterium]|nr:hypothetical protein [Betaproteobacteria bacterium]
MRISGIGQMFAQAVALASGMAGAAAQAADPVIEFCNANLDHYFVTISAAEADGIDRGAAGPGWHRTARVFGAYADAARRRPTPSRSAASTATSPRAVPIRTSTPRIRSSARR